MEDVDESKGGAPSRNALADNPGPNIEAARMETGKNFEIGQWFCSTGAHSTTVVHGPFESSESAFNFAHEKFGVVRFMSAPQWE